MVPYSVLFLVLYSDLYSVLFSVLYSVLLSVLYSVLYSVAFYRGTPAQLLLRHADRAQAVALLLQRAPDSGVQNNLQYVGITPPSAEGKIIDKVKDLAVKITNTLINLCKFLKMAQKEDEGIRQYVARLKGAADLCDFTVGSGMDTISYVD